MESHFLVITRQLQIFLWGSSPSDVSIVETRRQEKREAAAVFRTGQRKSLSSPQGNKPVTGFVKEKTRVWAEFSFLLRPENALEFIVPELSNLLLSCQRGAARASVGPCGHVALYKIDPTLLLFKAQPWSTTQPGAPHRRCSPHSSHSSQRTLPCWKLGSPIICLRTT